MQSNPVEQATIQEATRTRRGARVNLHGLSKSFAGRTVLQSIDLRVEPGEFVAIVGRSGCGKSTLLRLLAGLETPDGGSIAVEEAGGESGRAETRIMYQDSRLLPWKSVQSNVALGLTAGVEAAAETLRQVGLAERAADWPTVLSGGQRQRVALARALVHDPQLLLLDEPLGALDALTRIEMQQLIEAVWRERGFTAVLVTHDVQEAIALADRVLLIEDGRISLDQRVDLPRPRPRGSTQFARLEEYVLSQVLKHPASRPDSPLGDLSLQRSVSQVAWAV